MTLSGRVALISGGGRGIGRAIALALARDGADVAINYRRGEESARATAAEIESLGRKSRVYQADVADFEQDRAMVEAVLADFGKVDILVNNAGIASRGSLVADTAPEELQRVLGIHALGAFYLSKLVLPSMRQQPRGDIIFVSSAATENLSAGGAPYNMAKAAMEALARTLAKEERPHNIRVNVVAPGLVETEMGRRLVKATGGVDDMRKLDPLMPFGRVMQPEDVAETVAFLVSDRARYITGQVIYVHGGGQ